MKASSKNLALVVATTTTLWSLSQAVVQINDMKTYPPCLGDDDCENRHHLQDHRCFQYFCYPWKKAAVTASAKPRPLKECRRTKDCVAGGGPDKAVGQKCYRHNDRRKVTSGICVDSIGECSSHDECQDKGGKCCN